jgi:hypothetical protein
MTNKALVVLGLAAIGTGLAVAVNASATPKDDAGPVPPDGDGSGATFNVTANSGVNYDVTLVKVFDTEGGKQTFWDLFIGDDRIVRYTQLDDDMNSRVYIASPLAQSDPRLDLALRDFGIRFEGGAISDDMPEVVLASDVQTLPGQLMVLPGEYLATASVSFPKSLVVTAALIKGALQEQGFRQVAVFTSPPADWPISKSGDYFIQCVWAGQPRLFQLPKEVTDLRSRSEA